MDVYLSIEDLKTTTFNAVDTKEEWRIFQLSAELFAALVHEYGFCLTWLMLGGHILAELLCLSSVNEMLCYIFFIW